MGRQFEYVSSSRGAPMGRDHFCECDTSLVYLFRVHAVDGDYDDGGAYWGFGPGAGPLWCARDRRRDTKVQLFVRARKVEEAAKQIATQYPRLRIYYHAH